MRQLRTSAQDALSEALHKRTGDRFNLELAVRDRIDRRAAGRRRRRAPAELRDDFATLASLLIVESRAFGGRRVEDNFAFSVASGAGGSGSSETQSLGRGRFPAPISIFRVASAYCRSGVTNLSIIVIVASQFLDSTTSSRHTPTAG